MSGKSKPEAWPSGLVVIDKPGGMTSHDVVARVRRLAHTRRVGHAGTLDPMATGVLVIGIEKATRLLGHLMLTEKTYEATIRLGQSTTTDDAEGEPTGGSPAAGVTGEALDKEIATLTGEILQVPSSVSAIKVNGQRAYKLTRAGEAPELAARPVTIHEFRITAIRPEGDFLDIDATIRCSSGTYIRALARDLGNSLGTGGHLTALRRTAVGPYTLAQSHSLDTLQAQSQGQTQSPERSPAPHDLLAPSQGSPASPGSAAAPGLAASPGSPADGMGQAQPARLAPDQHGAQASSVSRCGPVPWVTPLAEAAAAAFPRLKLSDDEARRLAQGARLPLPSGQRLQPALGAAAPHRPSAAAPSAEPAGAVGHDVGIGLAPAETAPIRPGTPIAAFAPDGTFIALVTAEGERLRSLAVFVDASQA